MIGRCIDCEAVRLDVSFWTNLCEDCWRQAADPSARVEELIEQKGLVAPFGSLVHRPAPKRQENPRHG